MTSSAFSHLAMSVRSLDASTAFYREVFGCTPAPSGYRGAGRRLSALMELDDCRIRGRFLRKDTFLLELLEYDPARPTRTLPCRDDDLGFAHLSFVVADLDATAASVATHGGEMRAHTRVDFPFGEGAPTVIAFCTDPDGNRIELIHHPDAESARAHGRFLGVGAMGWPPSAGGTR